MRRNLTRVAYRIEAILADTAGIACALVANGAEWLGERADRWSDAARERIDANLRARV